MKKTIFALAFLLICLAPVSTAYAGSLNSYEKQVIVAAKRTYEYEGVTYRVASSYISQLIDYLITDGVDLDAEQRDEVIQTAFANIETGVDGGYLIPISSGNTKEDTSSEKGLDSTNTDNSSSGEGSGNTASDNDNGTESTAQNGDNGGESSNTVNNNTASNPDTGSAGYGTTNAGTNIGTDISENSDKDSNSGILEETKGEATASEGNLKDAAKDNQSGQEAAASDNTGVTTDTVKEKNWFHDVIGQDRNMVMIFGGIGLAVLLATVVAFRSRLFTRFNKR